VRLLLSELSTADQQKALDNGAIEVGFLREPIEGGALTCKTILREPFMVVLPPRHPLTARPDEIDLAEVAAEPFVHFPREVAPTLYDQVMEICRGAGFTPLVTQVASEWLTIVGLVEAGLGVSVVPSSFRKLGWGGVQYRPLSNVKKLTSIALCYKAESLSSQGEGFVRLVEGAAGAK
jgi:DNA-binding transcriptional LysR family regulator